jgi:uncharacterized protein
MLPEGSAAFGSFSDSLACAGRRRPCGHFRIIGEKRGSLGPDMDPSFPSPAGHAAVRIESRRMVIHELTAAECRAVLRLTTVGRLACARDGQPYIVPLFLYFDPRDDSLYGFSTLGQKIDWMRSNPKVCVEVEQIIDKFHWSTVVIFGRYEEVGDSAEEQELRHRASKLFEQRPLWWLPATGKIPAAEERHASVVYRIRIDRMSGRRASRPTDTTQDSEN